MSVKARPVRASALLGLVMLKVNDVAVLTRIVAAPKAFVMMGALATVKFAVLVLPVPPLVDVTAPVVLVNWPEAAPVTVTEN